MLRDEATPIESVAMAQKEMAEIEKMEAYDDYCLCFFDHIHEAILVVRFPRNSSWILWRR